MALDGILRNFPIPALGSILRVLIFPLGRRHRLPSDDLGRKVARLATEIGPTRDRLTAGIFQSDDPKDPMGRMDDAFTKSTAVKPIRDRLRSEGVRQPEQVDYADWMKQLLKDEKIDKDEKAALLAAHKAVMEVIQVDYFAPGKQQIKYKK